MQYLLLKVEQIGRFVVWVEVALKRCVLGSNSGDLRQARVLKLVLDNFKRGLQAPESNVEPGKEGCLVKHAV